MQSGYLVALALFLAFPHTTLTVSRLQFSVPRKNLLQEFNDGNTLTNEIMEGFETPESAERLRTALRALLELNDGELGALLKGVPVQTLKDHISPSTALFLQASRSRLGRLKSIISDQKDLRLQGDLLIARRNKKRHQLLRSEMRKGKVEEKDFEASRDTDSLLGALTELSESLEDGKRKGRRMQKKHKRHSFHTSTKDHNIHYRYWLKPEECPKASDGFPRVHCPSPTESGEWLCVDEQDLCDGHSHCPAHEDEQPMACLFFKSMQNYVEVLVSALLVSRRS